MTPTRRCSLAVALAAATSIFVPLPVAVIAVVAVLAASATDALLARRVPEVSRTASRIVSRGVLSSFAVTVGDDPRALVRQALVPDVELSPQEGRGGFVGELVARRRGRHELPPVAVRTHGPLGLGAWTRTAVGQPAEVLVYPDLVTARNLALAVRQGRFRDAGQFSRGPLGLGTDFESIREYVPDDDVRHVNWLATARVGRPMSNQLRIEQDRDVLCVIDAGRLMSAPIAGRTRMDAAVDAAAAVAMVADVVGDRCGVIVFDRGIRKHLRPRRSGGSDVLQAIFDVEPRTVDSDYELAFRAVGGAKRAFVLVLTDLLEEAAARPLVDAIGLLSRRHHVAVASVADDDLDEMIRRSPTVAGEVYETAVALEVRRARRAVVRRIRAAAADVVEASADGLARACVGAYLRAKSRALV